jgi:uncharacterized protein YutE (UPF0331/DUF86 family)
MKADDPRLEKSLRQAIERVDRVNEMVVTVLKNHLVVEQFMDEFLLFSGKKANGSFADKAQHCQTLKPPEIEPQIWKLLAAANQLRNKIAHTLDQAEIKTKMDEVRAAYLAALSDQQRPHSEKLDDVRIAAAAFELCGAYFVAATERASAGNDS